MNSNFIKKLPRNLVFTEHYGKNIALADDLNRVLHRSNIFR